MLVASFNMLLPEIVLTLGSMSLLIVGAFQRRENVVTILHLSALCLLLSIAILMTQNTVVATHLFDGQFVQDTFAQYLKIVILTLAIMVLLATKISMYQENIAYFEYPILVVLSLLGMMIMISANGFLTLFMGLELQSLCLYILSALRRNDTQASEAGMKYFILGALSTGMLLYGISLIYGSTGGLSFEIVRDTILNSTGISTGLFIGFTFVLAGVAFKVSVVPFHMWTPDVYEGAPNSITTFLSTVPKIAAFAILIRLLMDPFLAVLPSWSIMIMVLSIFSMVFGFIALLAQRNLKRLIAYSAIANAGYGLIGLLSGDALGIQATLIYMILYSITILGIFVSILMLSRRGESVETITDLSGISKIYPGLTFVMVLLFFSLAGIPPLSGFLGKLYIFRAALSADMMILATIGVIASVVGAAYYLWIIKIMTMDELNTENWIPSSQLNEDKTSLFILTLITGFIILFFIKPNIFVNYLSDAAGSLFIK